MSRVGKKPIPVPEKTEIVFKDRMVTVKGERGVLQRRIHPAVDLEIDPGPIVLTMVPPLLPPSTSRSTAGWMRR